MVHGIEWALHVLTIFQNATVGLINLNFEEHLPFDITGVNSMVRIAVALNDKRDGPTQADGRAPSLVAFNDKEWYIGASNWVSNAHVRSGSWVDVEVHQEDFGSGQGPAYLQVLGHDDAVCVAYIGQTWPKGPQRGWFGDMGRACGKRYYYSNLEVGEEKYKPGQCRRNGVWRLCYADFMHTFQRAVRNETELMS